MSVRQASGAWLVYIHRFTRERVIHAISTGHIIPGNEREEHVTNEKYIDTN